MLIALKQTLCSKTFQKIGVIIWSQPEWSPLQDSALTLYTNLRIGLKRLTVTSTSAYCSTESITITAVKYLLSGPRVRCKKFTAVIYKFLKEAVAFVPGRSCKPSLMFVGKDGAYLIEAPFRCTTLE